MMPKSIYLSLKYHVEILENLFKKTDEASVKLKILTKLS